MREHSLIYPNIRPPLLCYQTREKHYKKEKKNPPQMLANQIKKYKEVSFTVIKLDLILGHKDKLTYANQPLWYTYVKKKKDKKYMVTSINA